MRDRILGNGVQPFFLNERGRRPSSNYVEAVFARVGNGNPAFVTDAHLANGVVVRAFMIFVTRWRSAPSLVGTVPDSIPIGK